MALIENREHIKLLRESGKRLAAIMREISSATLPGVSARELNQIAENLIRKGGDTPAFLNYQPHGASRPYPATLNVSVNDEVVHGIPNEREKILRSGDIVLLDCGLSHRGLYTDMAITVPVGEVDAVGLRLIETARAALTKGIAAARAGNRISDITKAIWDSVKNTGFSLVEELGGHGVGYAQHEEPYVPNTPAPGRSPLLRKGMVLAIEPIVNEGSRHIKLMEDGYTYKTVDGKRSAEFEHTVLITEGDAEIITA